MNFWYTLILKMSDGLISNSNLIFSACILPIHMVPTAKRFGNSACTSFTFVGHPCHPHKKVTLKKHRFVDQFFSFFSIWEPYFRKVSNPTKLVCGVLQYESNAGPNVKIGKLLLLKIQFFLIGSAPL